MFNCCSVVVFKYDYVDNKVYLEKQEAKKPAKGKTVDTKTAAKKPATKPVKKPAVENE